MGKLYTLQWTNTMPEKKKTPMPPGLEGRMADVEFKVKKKQGKK